MYCVKDGIVSVQVYDNVRNCYRYFPAGIWERMSTEKKARYSETPRAVIEK